MDAASLAAEDLAQVMTEREQRELVPSKRVRTPVRRQMSEALRRANQSPEHKARFRATIERLRAEGRYPSPKGVRQGYAGRTGRKLWQRINDAAKAETQKIMDELIKEGKVDKDAAGNAALEFAIQVIRATDPEKANKPAYGVRERLQAAKLLAEFTLQKPTAKTETHLTSAEDFLAGVLAKSGETP